MLSKGSKIQMKVFDKFVKLRRAYLVKMYKKFSAVYLKKGTAPKLLMQANNALHHNILNNLRKSPKLWWKRRKDGTWECNGCQKYKVGTIKKGRSYFSKK